MSSEPLATSASPSDEEIIRRVRYWLEKGKEGRDVELSWLKRICTLASKSVRSETRLATSQRCSCGYPGLECLGNRKDCLAEKPSAASAAAMTATHICGGEERNWSQADCTLCGDGPSPAAPVASDLLRQLVLDCQNDLATYIVPDSGISEHDVVNTLLGRLDGPQARAALGTASSARLATEAVPVADIEAEIAHIEENGQRVKELPGMTDEWRCRELCAMYLREFISNLRANKRLAELSARPAAPSSEGVTCPECATARAAANSWKDELMRLKSAQPAAPVTTFTCSDCGLEYVKASSVVSATGEKKP